MRSLVFFAVLLVVASCGTRVPYTDQLMEDFDLSPQNLTKVQFYTSSVIIFEKSKSSGNQTTGDDGTLVSNSNKTQDRVIIPANTKCKFEKMGEGTEVVVRFELGTGRVLRFNTRSAGQSNGKYYLVTQMEENKPATIQYGNDTYTVQSGGSSAYLQVVLKKLQKTKRKDHIVKGLKV